MPSFRMFPQKYYDKPVRERTRNLLRLTDEFLVIIRLP